MKADQDETVERMGRHYESEGMPRIAGRLYGRMLVEEDPLSLDDLAQELQVSKTSVSTNARLLEQFGLIERFTKPGDRRDYYVAAPDQTRTLELRLGGIREMGKLLEEALRGTPKGKRRTRARLEKMSRFNDEALDVLQGLLATWRGKPI